MRINVEINATPSELADFVTRIRNVLLPVRDVHDVEILTPAHGTLTLNDPRTIAPR